MKKYANLYTGLNGRYIIGGIDLDKIEKGHSDLEVWDGKVKVGFINKDVLLMGKKIKDEYLEPHILYTDNAGY